MNKYNIYFEYINNLVALYIRNIQKIYRKLLNLKKNQILL